eukprot:gene55587-58020_t
MLLEAAGAATEGEVQIRKQAQRIRAQSAISVGTRPSRHSLSPDGAPDAPSRSGTGDMFRQGAAGSWAERRWCVGQPRPPHAPARDDVLRLRTVADADAAVEKVAGEVSRCVGDLRRLRALQQALEARRAALAAAPAAAAGTGRPVLDAARRGDDTRIAALLKEGA